MIKRKLFRFCLEQTKNSFNNGFVAIIGKLIEFFQINIIALKVLGSFSMDSKVMNFLYDISNALVFSIKGDLTIRMIFIYIVLFMTIFKISIIFMTPKSLNANSTDISYFLQLLINICSGWTILLYYILVLPIQYSIADNLLRMSFDNIFHIIYMILAIFAQIGLVLNFVLVLMCTIELNPESDALWSSYGYLLNLLRILFKVIIGVVLAIGNHYEILNELTLLVGICALILIIGQWREGEYKFWIDQFSAFQEILCSTIHIGVFVMHITSKSKNIFYASIGIGMFCVGSYNILKKRKKEEIIFLPMAKQKSVTDIIFYIKVIFDTINNLSINKNYIRLVRAITCHRTACNNSNCPCGKIMKLVNDENSLDKNKGKKVSNASISSAIEKKLHKLLKSFIEENLASTNNSPALYLQLSYVELYKLKNHSTALVSLQKGIVNNHSLLFEFIMYKQINEIEKNAILRYETIGKYSVKTTENIEYMTEMNKFIESIDKITSYNEKLWNILTQNEFSSSALIICGKLIMKEINKNSCLYNKVSKYSTYNVEFLIRYADFLMNVVHDDIKLQAILEKIRNQKKSEFIQSQNWNCWEGKTGLMKVSGNKQSLGKILDIAYIQIKQN